MVLAVMALMVAVPASGYAQTPSGDKMKDDNRAGGTSDAKWQSAIRWKDTVDQENKWEKLTS
jgi:hypothetical protein